MPSDSQHLANLRQMIIQQYMLHEVQHHALQAGNQPAQTPLTPIAHSLIDIYKCLHQGEFGVGHTIDHPEGFKQRLYQEIMGDAAPGPVCEPVVEDVSADGNMLRVNLRALRHLYGDDVAAAVNDLARVCIKSARVTQGRTARFFETLDLFRMLNQAGEIVLAGHVFAFPSEWLDRFFFEVRELMGRIREVPVFGHSATYKHLNRPSYRVVERSVLQASALAVLLEKCK